MNFGCSGRARFHTAGVNERYLRVFHANPSSAGTQYGDGDHEWDVEISLGVSFALQKKVAEMLETELDRLSNTASNR